jgi:UPF0042 nucleotide-binding protein
VAAARTVVVTGMSGAGRSSCLKVLEDLGFEAVDNLPLELMARLLPGEPAARDLAIGVDSRTRAFAPETLLDLLRGGGAGCQPASLLFLECDDEILRRRFTETRRRHPLALDRPVGDGIARERRLLRPLKAAADLVIDTSLLSVADLRRLLADRFAAPGGSAPAISIVSFAYRQGLPREADLVLDVRFLANPHYVEALRPRTGLDAEVQAHVRGDPDLAPFLDRLETLLVPLLPRYNAEGKSYLTIGIGCTGGRHRSVFIAEQLAARLRAAGSVVHVVHRELQAAGVAGERP